MALWHARQLEGSRYVVRLTDSHIDLPSFEQETNMAMQDPKKAEAQPPFPKQEQPHPGSESKMSPKPDYGESSYKGLGRLKDRVALVTGGDSGIGRAVALAFAREGADVVVHYLNEHEDAKQTERIVKDAGRKCVTIAADLSTEAGCKATVEAATRAFGRIDCLVNNAAFQGKAVSNIGDLDYARVEHTFKTNVVAMFGMVRLAMPHMKPGATVINVGSIQAYDPSQSILDYASTKGAIVAFTKGLAQELIATKGIRVNCVAPGPVWTPLIVQSFSAEKSSQFGAKAPMQRPAQPKELAPAFVFLACEESSYVNGEVLGVTGGELLG